MKFQTIATMDLINGQSENLNLRVVKDLSKNAYSVKTPADTTNIYLGYNGEKDNNTSGNLEFWYSHFFMSKEYWENINRYLETKEFGIIKKPLIEVINGHPADKVSGNGQREPKNNELCRKFAGGAKTSMFESESTFPSDSEKLHACIFYSYGIIERNAQSGKPEHNKADGIAPNMSVDSKGIHQQPTTVLPENDKGSIGPTILQVDQIVKIFDGPPKGKTKESHRSKNENCISKGDDEPSWPIAPYLEDSVSKPGIESVPAMQGEDSARRQTRSATRAKRYVAPDPILDTSDQEPTKKIPTSICHRHQKLFLRQAQEQPHPRDSEDNPEVPQNYDQHRSM